MEFFKKFDVNAEIEAKEVGEFDNTPIPAGHYAVVCERAEETVTKSTNTEAIKFAWSVAEGKHKGRWLWDQCNVDHPTESYAKREAKRFQDICKGTKTLSPKTAGDFPGTACTVEVTIEPASNGYEAKNRIKSYLPAMPTESSAPAPADGPAAPKRVGDDSWG
jgi:hypothetical protein